MGSDAEIRKLARVLGVSPDRFGYLRDVPAADVRLLREQMTSTLFDAHLGVLERMAGASRLLPSPVLAKMAEKVFGPLLSARIAGLVDVSRGVDIAKRLPPRFLADVAAELDPRRAAGIIAGLPAPVVVAVARELARREDWITIARFVDTLPERGIVASLEVIPNEALPQVAEMLDDPARVRYVLDLRPEHRMDAISDDLAG
jgi:AcrR family transcriptional regulator